MNEAAAKPRKRKVVEKKPVEDLRIGYEPLSWLLAHQAPRNPKTHDVEGVDASMSRFGFTIPVAIDEGTNTVVAGHGRLEVLAARKAAGGAPPERVKVAPDGDWLVPVIRGLSFGSAEEAEAYLIADNRHVEIGGYREDLLADMLSDIRGRDGGLVGLGWTDDQVTDRLASLRAAADSSGSTLNDLRDRNPPPEFPEHNADSKKTIHCPRCGFDIVEDA